ncbi:Site-specific recombinase XerD [Prauserella alba]|nr:Site-specific recombinase XerD [Prauserella alba]
MPPVASGTIYKRCLCKDPETGRTWGAACPKLKRRSGAWSSDHGTWYFQVELPRTHGGARRTRRRGGYASQASAEADLEQICAVIDTAKPHGDAALATVGDLIDARLQAREPIPDPAETAAQLTRAGSDSLTQLPTVGEWLHTWLDSRKTLRGKTRISYESHLHLWLVPHLGHHRLDALTVDHISCMFDAMAERNDTITAAQTSSDDDVRASVRGMRVMGPATMQRYRATLRAALNAAIRAQKITFNPASFVELPSGRRPKALLWTAERVERWQRTRDKPSRVMVWTPEQTGRFLDHADGHPYYSLLHLIAYRGLRRGEACGLRWWDVDLNRATITISSALVLQGWRAEFGEPKSEASGRVIALDDATAEVLREQKRHQDQQRQRVGEDWQDNDLVCSEPNGAPLHPAKLTDAFRAIADGADLPPVRLHDLRHGAATLALATGADLKLVQELLGHSSISVTADTYTHVLPDLAHKTAEQAAALVPRGR